MPWTAGDASGKTHKADTTAKKEKWQAIANAVLKKDANEGKAVRIANAAMMARPKTKAKPKDADNDND